MNSLNNTEGYWDQRLLGISLKEYGAVALFYFLSSIVYRITISGGALAEVFAHPFWEVWISFVRVWLDYGVKLILTIPIWWLIFREMRGIKLGYRLLVHSIGLPVFIFSFQYIYYRLCEWIGFWHLEGGGEIWDLYIPGLFYCFQFGIFHAYEYYRQNQQDIMAKSILRESALKSELSALKAQLNPHFLYNVFNTISASVPVEQEETRELIAKLSDLFRYQLKASKEERVPLREELAFVEKYLDLEKARFEDRLEVSVEVAEEVKDEMVPPMILQPLVENSLKHGIASLIDGGEVAIRVRREGENLVFEVADTGVGVNDQDKKKLLNVGVGLTNTQLRLEKLYGSELKISDNVPRGLKITFAI